MDFQTVVSEINDRLKKKITAQTKTAKDVHINQVEVMIYQLVWGNA